MDSPTFRTLATDTLDHIEGLGTELAEVYQALYDLDPVINWISIKYPAAMQEMPKSLFDAIGRANKVLRKYPQAADHC